MYAKICVCCGKIFPSKSNKKKYCSEECRREAIKKKREEDDQICIFCKKACGGCSWSRRFIPVRGWDAIPTIIKNTNGDIPSYKINTCPQFIRG